MAALKYRVAALAAENMFYLCSLDEKKRNYLSESYREVRFCSVSDSWSPMMIAGSGKHPAGVLKPTQVLKRQCKAVGNTRLPAAGPMVLLASGGTVS